MDSMLLVEEVDFAIENLVMQKGVPLTEVDPAVMELVVLAAEIRALPRPEFREALKSDLLAEGFAIDTKAETGKIASMPSIRARMRPPLFQSGQAGSPLRGPSLGASVLIHAGIIGLLVFGGMYGVNSSSRGVQEVSMLVSPEAELPISAQSLRGGGGGGDRSKFEASQGTPPRNTLQVISPPLVVKRNPDPELIRESAILAPPDVHFKTPATIGDPLSQALNASNGIGAESGIGSGGGGGIGTGTGRGLGPGYAGGYGGGIFRVGGGVTAPRLISGAEPQYSDEARKAEFQGIVVLAAVVTPDGIPHNIHVARSLGMGLDEKAVDAVKNWRFEPGKKDGKPVAVLVNIEVQFRLY